MRSFNWIAAVTVVGLVLGHGVAQAECARPDPARIQVRLFKYNGVESGPAKDAFSIFHWALAKRLKTLRPILASHEHAKYLRGLSVLPDSGQHAAVRDSPGEAKIEVMWQFYDETLIIMTGALKGQSVETEFFWGTLEPNAFANLITAESEFSGDDYARANDTFAMVVLAGLGLDAMRRECRGDVVLHIFSEADKIAQDLERRPKPLTGDLARLRHFISEMLKRVS